MADSLTSECTPLKQKYDACFNAWFEGYLEPAIANNASAAERAAYSKMKANEYQAKCGQIWENYRECVQKAVKQKGLEKLLQQAREEFPLKEPPTPPSSQFKK